MKSFMPQLTMAPQVAALLKLAGHAAFVASGRAAAPVPATADAITNWEGGVTYRPAVVARPVFTLHRPARRSSCRCSEPICFWK